MPLTPPTHTRIRANGYFLATQLWLEMAKGLRERRLVTRFVLEPLDGDDPLGEIEFELRVTRICGVPLPPSLDGATGPTTTTTGETE